MEIGHSFFNFSFLFQQTKGKVLIFFQKLLDSSSSFSF